MMKPLITTLLCLTVLSTSPSIGVAQNNLVGMKWAINLEKSKYHPGPGPRSGVLGYEATDGGFIVTFEGVNAQGNPVKEIFGPYKLDGKPYPVAGVAAYDATSYKVINDSTAEIVRFKVDKPVQTSTRVLSADGKTLTFTTTGINARGEQLNNVVVYDRQ
jgi:hypothetical protein